MDDILQILAAEFDYRGLGHDFEGDVIATTTFSIGKNIDCDGREVYYMLNHNNQIIYEFHDANHARAIYQMVLTGR